MRKDFRARLLCAGLAGLAIAQIAHAEIGRIKNEVGQAQVVRAGQTIPVTPGFKLEPTDVLVTGKDGRIGMTFTDDSRISIGPNSRIAIATYQYDRARETGLFVANVDKGSAVFASGKIARSAKDAMQVHTPTTILGVIGTRFVVVVP